LKSEAGSQPPPVGGPTSDFKAVENALAKVAGLAIFSCLINDLKTLLGAEALAGHLNGSYFCSAKTLCHTLPARRF
jgi:hypothetical protein